MAQRLMTCSSLVRSVLVGDPDQTVASSIVSARSLPLSK
jgi:hypothetical protein